MIDSDYEAFMHNKSFLKRVSSLQHGAKSKAAIQANLSKEKRSFPGNKSFPQGFVTNPEGYANFVIDVKEYAREYMQNLRVLHKYTREDFFESLQPSTNEEKLKALFDKTSARGGNPLFSTANKKFIIKQITPYEKKTLLNTFLLPYHEHVIQNSSYITRVLGLFAIRVKYLFPDSSRSGKFKIYILVMQNIDPIPGELLDFKYDLKMSTVSRQQLSNHEIEAARAYYLALGAGYDEILRADSGNKLERLRAIKRSHLSEGVRGNLSKLKDIDFLHFHQSLPIAATQASLWEMAQAKITKDVRFLESINIMDYSMILTVAHTKSGRGQEEAKARAAEGGLVEEEKMPEVLQKLHRNGNCLFSPSGSFAYIFGIIDILQEYDIQKRSEERLKKAKALITGKSDISCQPPGAYADRFLSKLGSVFVVAGEEAEEGLRPGLFLSEVRVPSPKTKHD
jgi:hypothetical protein